MSSTTNTQNLLTNVFRPTFVYNTVTGNYQMKLELTNVDIVSANTVTSFAANIGDENGNLYLGTGSGNAYSTLAASSNTTNTFVGTGAGGATSNVKNGVFIGYRAGYGASNSSNSISIGANTLNGGNSNIYIGCATGIATGSNNIFLGAGVSNGGASTCNTLIVGSGSNTLLVGDLANNRIGVNLSNLPVFNPSVPILLDVNGYARVGTSNNGRLGVNISPTYSLDVNGNMRMSDGYGTLILSNDSLGISRTTISGIVSPGGSSPAIGQATLQVSDGFFSANGTIVIANGASSNIGTLKRGLVMISAEDSRTTSNVSASKIFMATLSNGTFVTSVVGTSSNLALISNVTSNIVLSNTDSNSHTFAYSITYFPSPGTSLAGAVIVTLANLGANDSFIAKYNSSGAVQWAARQGGSGYDSANGVTADSAGNIIVTGTYGSSTLTIYNFDGSAFGTTLAVSGGDDSFIAKYNSEGLVQWVARQAGTGTDIGNTVTADSAGNVLVMGNYTSSPLTIYNADGSAFATTLANSGANDAFIANYNSAGVVQWVARMAGVDFDSGRSITVDSAGNILVAGSFQSTLTIYNFDGSAFGTTLTSSGNYDVFIAKYNSAGVVQWAARLSGTASDTARGVAVDLAGNVIVSGTYISNPLTIYNADGSPFGTTLTSSGNDDSFIAKYNSAGVVQWAARQGGTDSDFGTSLTVDSTGNIIVGGYYGTNPLIAYNSDGSPFARSLTNSGGYDAFIAKYNSAGAVQWVARQGGSGDNYTRSLSADSAGNILVAGVYQSTLVVGNSDGSSFATSVGNSGAHDSFVVKYNSAGFVQWVARQGGTADDYGTGVIADSTGNVIVAGQCYSPNMMIYNA
jgi:hypothetical protein